MSDLLLRGVSPRPFISYLKGLGIFKLVSQQKDPGARCEWHGEHLALQTRLDHDGLLDFFLSEYSPTPVANPWNGGSGFYEGEDRLVIEAIATTTEERFKDYREVLKVIDRVVGPEDSSTLMQMLMPLRQKAERLLGKDWESGFPVFDEAAFGSMGVKKKDTAELRLLYDAIIPLQSIQRSVPHLNIMDLSYDEFETKVRGSVPKELGLEESSVGAACKALRKVRTKINKESRSNEDKAKLVMDLRAELSERGLEWLDAVVQVDANGKFRTFPILGSGGNEGRLEYGKTFMDDLVAVLLTGDIGNSRKFLENALFDSNVDGLPVCSVGYFDPGKTGGFNQGPGFENKDFPTNPWNFILAMEGATVWSGNVTRRLEHSNRSTISAPFTVRSSGVGYASSADLDSEEARGEIWTPLWNRPVDYSELKAFISEGRAELGRGEVRSGLEFAEAVATLGVDRGITEFVRYGILKRRGDSYVALPLGRFPVRYRSEGDLIREANGIVYRIDRFLSRMKQPPAQYRSARRRIEDAMLRALSQGRDHSLKSVLIALGRFEMLVCSRDPSKVMPDRPFSGLRPSWLRLADDGTLEFRVAAALASIRPSGDVGSIRSNIGPVSKKGDKWNADQMAWVGNSFRGRLVSVLRKRLLDAQRTGSDRNPLFGLLPLCPEDISMFIEGLTDDATIEQLLYGMCLIRWSDMREKEEVVGEIRRRWATPTRSYMVARPWILLKMMFLPYELSLPSGGMKSLLADPSIVALLIGGRTDEACKVAAGRLFVAGFGKVDFEVPPETNGVSLAAALLVPVRNDFQQNIYVNQLLR